MGQFRSTMATDSMRAMDSLLTTEETVLLRHDEDKIDRELEKLMSMDSTRIFSSRSFDLTCSRTCSFNSDNDNLCAKFENVAITPEVMRAWRLQSYDIVIDYNKEDWGRRLAGQNYDLIFDCVGDERDVAKAP